MSVRLQPGAEPRNKIEQSFASRKNHLRAFVGGSALKVGDFSPGQMPKWLLKNARSWSDVTPKLDAAALIEAPCCIIWIASHSRCLASHALVLFPMCLRICRRNVEAETPQDLRVRRRTTWSAVRVPGQFLDVVQFRVHTGSLRVISFLQCGQRIFWPMAWGGNSMCCLQ